MTNQTSQKTLTVIVPAYNVEQYIERCLKSIVVFNDIEIIVIDDGSTDGTLRVIKQLQKQYPKNITVVAKENGGHGSTINVGIKKATGKYVRVLDSDDWLNPETLGKYIEALKKSDSDIVLTDYSRKIAKGDTDDFATASYSFKQDLAQKEYKIADYLSLDTRLDLIELFSIHTISVKTDTIKKAWGDGLLEKTFYEDQEWVAKAIMAASSFKYYAIDVYQYYIGRNEQSMNKDKMFKNRKHHERVVMRLVEIAKQADKTKQKILIARIATVVRTHYWIYFYHPRLKQNEREEYATLKTYLGKNMPEALKNISLKFKIRLFIGRKRQEIYNR